MKAVEGLPVGAFLGTLTFSEDGVVTLGEFGVVALGMFRVGGGDACG